QDLGRSHYRASGLPAAGAMDAGALRLANIMVGNPQSTAGLEITLIGPGIRFSGEGVVALAGGDLGAQLNGWPLPAVGSFTVADGDRLSFAAPRSGCRSYLAVQGGFDLPDIMGSYSTYLRGAFGGYQGRALRSGDILATLPTAANQSSLWVGPLPPHLAEQIARPFPISSQFPTDCIPTARVILGPQDDYFDQENITLFLNTTWQVSNEADRMGYRLSGTTLKHNDKKEIVSDGILCGAIQVPAQGIPIVLLADAQTAGGYAKIATVIGSDLRIFGQLQPGDEVRFTSVSWEAALQALHDDNEYLGKVAQWLAENAAATPVKYAVSLGGQSYKVTVYQHIT
ncbi:MAG: biotin-dependent carboxyltransferase family protein, partial [Symbiobacteriaceae bacterium]|nr:biotin-dependent carboxyltransferase family protein [Symbiobacteriaceae bacterium]